MTDNQTPQTLTEKIYGVPGAVQALRVPHVAGKVIRFEGFAVIPTPEHIAAAMAASDKECPEMIGVATVIVDGQKSALIIMSEALRDQLGTLAAHMPFDAPIISRKSKSGYNYYQIEVS